MTKRRGITVEVSSPIKSFSQGMPCKIDSRTRTTCTLVLAVKVTDTHLHTVQTHIQTPYNYVIAVSLANYLDNIMKIYILWNTTIIFTQQFNRK